MTKKLLLSLTVTTSLTSPAMAENWYELATGNEVMVLADRDSVQKNGANTLVNGFLGFYNAQGEGLNIYYIKRRIEFDCTGRQVRTLTVDLFDGQHNPIAPQEFDRTWQPIAAGTSDEAFSGFACNGQNPGLPYPDPFAAADDYWDYYYYYYG